MSKNLRELLHNSGNEARRDSLNNLGEAKRLAASHLEDMRDKLGWLTDGLKKPTFLEEADQILMLAMLSGNFSDPLMPPDDPDFAAYIVLAFDEVAFDEGFDYFRDPNGVRKEIERLTTSEGPSSQTFPGGDGPNEP